MNKLSKTQIEEKDSHATSLSEKRTALAAAVDAFNERMAEEWANVEASLVSYNDAVEAAEGWRGEIESEQSDYFDNRTEAWQEGDKGQAYTSWKDLWAEAWEPVELSKPDDLDLDADDLAEKINNDLTDSPEGND